MPTLTDLTGQYEEIVTRRTQNFKVFEVNAGLRHFAVSGKIGFMHYRDDPEDQEEPFKDIHASLALDKFGGVPFLTGEMDPRGYPELTITHRTTKQRVILALADELGSVKSDTAKSDLGSKRAWNDGKFGFESLGEGGIKAWYIIPDAASSHVVRFLLHADEKIEWRGEAHSEEDSSPRLFVAGAIHWTPFWAKDAAGAFLPIHSDYDERTGVMTLTVEPDPKGKTQYPILIDPTAIAQEVVGASADDAKTYGSTYPGTESFTTVTTTIYLGGIRDSGNTSYFYCTGVRFTTIPIPNAATINSAYLTFKCHGASSTDTDVVIHCDDTDSSLTFAADNLPGVEVWARRTSASVRWDIGTTAWTVNNSYASPDLSGPVKEVVDRDGWATNSNLSFVTAAYDAGGYGAGGNASFCRDCYSYDHATEGTNATLFDCTYTAAAAGKAYCQVVMT
jgi:hypothetical protein